MEYLYLLILALILASTKLFGLLSRKVNMPQVVGALLAGVLIGPTVLNLVGADNSVLAGGDSLAFINHTAEIGVIMLMFLAGIGTDFSELKKTGVASFIIALIGVIVPMAGSGLTYGLFYGFDFSNQLELCKTIFVGVVLMATSVSITVETLRELGKLKTKMGTAILGAAIIDDIIGIIVLTLVTGLQDPQVNPVESVVKIVLFFVFVVVCAVVVKLLSKIPKKFYAKKHRIVIFGLSFAFVMSFCAEYFFGVADITGAYFAGLILCNYSSHEYIDEKVSIASFAFFSPVFFASIGIKTHVTSMDSTILWFTVVLLVVAILSKVVGCGLGAKLCKFNNKEALGIGIGMVSRGEVALIVAQKGNEAGIIDAALFPPIVVVVIVTTIITPILLKIVLADKANGDTEKEKSKSKSKKTKTAAAAAK